MKLKLDKVIFINLLFRIFLLIYLLKEEKQEKSQNIKALRHWLDPITKRVILIFINGLGKDFLKQNATPYLKEMLDTYGAFGIALTRYMQTNHEGIKAVLTGKNSPSFPFSWMDANCHDNILDYVAFSCGMGDIPRELSLRCYFPDNYPLDSFQKFPELFQMKRRRSSLYVMSFNLDPVLIKDYQSRLKKIDDDIRFFASMVDNFYGDNKTTYIVTSARGSPVGKSLSIDAPVIAWGKGIEVYREITYMKQTDLTALLCALLGVNFPTGLFGVIPMSMMDLQDHYEFELTLYTIRHFERVLEVVDVKDHLYDSSELEMEQLTTRLGHIILEIKRSKLIKWSLNCFLLIVLLMVWGLNLISYACSGFACFFWHLKSFFLLLLVIGTTLSYSLLGLELLVALELLLFWTWQNNKQIREAFCKNVSVIFQTPVIIFTAVTVVGFIGNQIAVPLMFVPVILWPIINGSYVKINRFVLFTRLLSGIALGVLPFNRIFGEMPDRWFITSVSFLFLLNFYFLLSIFKRDFDDYMKINFLMILTTTAHVYFIHQYESDAVKDTATCFFLVFSVLSVYAASGTLLEKFFKILSSLFIPVIMLSIRIECVFYLSILFHAFTWIFIDYHSANPTQYQFSPSIFSIEPKKSLKTFRFSDEDVRLIVFFLIYSFVSYFAIGHYPDLHSYDLYVVPTFIFEYPFGVSYFLGGLKFFLPFFIVTISFVTLCTVKEKDFKPMIAISIWVSDLIGCFLIFYSQFVNRIFQRIVFPAKFSYFIIQQFAAVSVILSYFIGQHLLFDSEKFMQKIFGKRNYEEINVT